MIVLFVAVMAVIGSQGNFPISFGTPGLVRNCSFHKFPWQSEKHNKKVYNFESQVGLALSYAAPLVSLLGSFLTSFTETEKEMVSVERVLQVMMILIKTNHLSLC